MLYNNSRFQKRSVQLKLAAYGFGQLTEQDNLVEVIRWRFL